MRQSGRMSDQPPSYRGFERLPLVKAGGRETTGLLVAKQVSLVRAEDGMSARIPPRVVHLAAIHRRHRSHISIDGRTFFDGVQEAGEFSIFGPDGRLDVTTWSEWDCTTVFLPWATVTDIAERSGLVRTPGELETLPRISHADPEIDALARDMARELARSDQFTPWRMDVLAQRLAVSLLRGHSNRGVAAAPPASAEPLTPRQHAMARELLDASGAEGPDLAALAAAVDTSPERFCAAFKATTGVGPLAWLLARRIDEAKRRLAEKGERIDEVAAALGFPTTDLLQSRFREVVGMPIAAWLRQARQ